MSARDCLIAMCAELEVVARLEAIVAELEPGGDGPEVASVLAEGLLEELRAALNEQGAAG